ncbi:MAG TPA: hypothetical protein PK781_01940 [Terrimesophilobacter sp.]|nr:hypothetical protein [Terrimesophilobacter sp.]HRP99204.1 hypothetical protein [Terrimesophilobacter sp.]
MIDGRTYAFSSELSTSCRAIAGLLSVTLDIESVDGEAIDTEEGHLILGLPGPEGFSDAVAENVEVKVRIPNPEDVGGLEYQAGDWVDEPVTLVRDGFSTSGTQILVNQSGAYPPVTAQIDARCTE